MTFQILISTVSAAFFKKNKVVPSNYILINQYNNHDKKANAEQAYNFNEKGLAKSRNRALELATADICLISDDDIEYTEDIETIIINAFKEYVDADIITFQIKTPEGEMYKKYKDTPFWHTTKTLMSVSSVEIAFKLKSIHTAELHFDEHFGLGSTFPTGEEIIFLTDALKKNLKILYIPIPIVVHPIESSGKNYDNIGLIKAKGAMFYRMFGNIGYFVAIVFAYKKYKVSSFSLIQFIVLMFNGITTYKRSIK